MTECCKRDAWMTGALDPSTAQRFERHLETCRECRQHLAEWEQVKTRFAGWVSARESRVPPSAQEARALVDAVMARMPDIEETPSRRVHVPHGVRHGRLSFRVAVAGGLVAAALALVVIGIALYLIPKTGHPEMVQKTAEPGFAIAASDVGPGKRVRTRAGQQRWMQLHQSRVTLREDSAALVVKMEAQETVIVLERGGIVCTVEPRLTGGVFQVQAGDVTVSVLGTTFSVYRADDGEVRVEVMEGRVRVQQGAREEILMSGETLVLPPVDDADAVVALEPGNSDVPDDRKGVRRQGRGVAVSEHPSADLDTWRSLIANGQLDEAAAQLGRYLEAVPANARVRMLLAGVLRRQGRDAEALSACETVIVTGTAAMAQQARYLAGEIALMRLGDPQRAAGFFRAYLDGASVDATHRAEAEIHLSQALYRMGQADEARRRLEQVAAQYGRTPAGDRARRMLQNRNDTTTPSDVD